MGHPNRRRILQFAIGSIAALTVSSVVAGCDGPTPDDPGSLPDGVSDADLAEQVRSEQFLIAQYERAITSWDGREADRESLVMLRDQHRQHLVAMTDAGFPLASPSSGDPTTIPADLEGLLKAERDACALRSAGAAAAAQPPIARLLTFIAAAEGSHVTYLLQRGRSSSP